MNEKTSEIFFLSVIFILTSFLYSFYSYFALSMPLYQLFVEIALWNVGFFMSYNVLWLSRNIKNIGLTYFYLGIFLIFATTICYSRSAFILRFFSRFVFGYFSHRLLSMWKQNKFLQYFCSQNKSSQYTFNRDKLNSHYRRSNFSHERLQRPLSAVNSDVITHSRAYFRRENNIVMRNHLSSTENKVENKVTSVTERAGRLPYRAPANGIQYDRMETKFSSSSFLDSAYGNILTYANNFEPNHLFRVLPTYFSVSNTLLAHANKGLNYASILF